MTITPKEMVLRIAAKSKELCEIHDKASKEYAADHDALANFKRRAIESGVSPLQAWHLYAGKHWDGISAFIRNGAEQREPIEGRFNDLLVYLHLGLALLEEVRNSQPA